MNIKGKYQIELKKEEFEAWLTIFAINKDAGHIRTNGEILTEEL